MKLKDFLSLTDQGVKSGLITEEAEISFLAGKNESPITSFGFVDGNIILSFTIDKKISTQTDADVFSAPAAPIRVLPPPKFKAAVPRKPIKAGSTQEKIIRALQEHPTEPQSYRAIEARLNALSKNKKKRVAYETVIGNVKSLKNKGIVDILPSKTPGRLYDIRLKT